MGRTSRRRSARICDTGCRISAEPMRDRDRVQREQEARAPLAEGHARGRMATPSRAARPLRLRSERQRGWVPRQGRAPRGRTFGHHADNETAPDLRFHWSGACSCTPSGTRTPNPLRTLRSSERRRVVAANGGLTCAFVDPRRLPSLVARALSAGLSGHFVGSSEDLTGGRHSQPAVRRQRLDLPAVSIPPNELVLSSYYRFPGHNHDESAASKDIARPDPGLLRATSPEPPSRQVPPLTPPRRSFGLGLERERLETQPTRPRHGHAAQNDVPLHRFAESFGRPWCGSACVNPGCRRPGSRTPTRCRTLPKHASIGAR